MPDVGPIDPANLAAIAVAIAGSNRCAEPVAEPGSHPNTDAGAIGDAFARSDSVSDLLGADRTAKPRTDRRVRERERNRAH